MTQRRPMALLFVTLFLVMLGFGVIIPVLPFYVRHFGGNSTTLGLLLATYSAVQFFMAPVWGRLSDRIGRRPVLLVGLSGYGMAFLLYGFADALWMLFAARTLAGFLSSATIPTAMAYVADITTPEERPKGMGIMGAAMGLGMIFGPATGGFLAEVSLSMPFFVAGGVALVTLPFAWRWLPESHPDDKRAVGTQPRRLGEAFHHPLLPLFLMGFAISASMSMFEATFALFSADRLHLTTAEMGAMFASLGVVGVFIQVRLIGKLVNTHGDLKIMLLGVGLTAIGLLLMIPSWSFASMWCACLVFTGGNTLLRPSVSTLVSKVAKEGQGKAAGQLQSFDALGRIVGPVVGGASYGLHWAAPNGIGAVFLAVLLLATFPRLKGIAGLLRG